jgi:ubiquinone/menaquinone biosynthesis C-methylase UbiE
MTALPKKVIERQVITLENLFGSDIDAEAIRWLNENCQSWGRFSANSASPPLPFASENFDLIYSISVFTHLPEEMQNSWLAELHRIAKPGNFVLATIHGQKLYSKLNASNRKEFLRKGFYCVTRFGKPVAEVTPPFVPGDKGRRVGTMMGTIRIKGDIVHPPADPDDWGVLQR